MRLPDSLAHDGKLTQNVVVGWLLPDGVLIAEAFLADAGKLLAHGGVLAFEDRHFIASNNLTVIR
jgi:hypothetical protein